MVKVDIRRFYRACNPSTTLDVGKPEDKQLYVDFSTVRGDKIIDELATSIARRDSFEPSCQLFTGHIGCGKSTELKVLQVRLEQQGFHVVYFESDESLDLANVEVTDILLAMSYKIAQNLEDSGIRLQTGSFRDLFRQIRRQLPGIDISEDVDLTLGLAKMTVAIKDSPTLRNQLKNYLEPQAASILRIINDELLQIASEKLKYRGKKGLVVIVDNLDRIDPTMKVGSYSLPEFLFIEQYEKLRNLNCHIVYTIPLILRFSDSTAVMALRYGQSPKNLPMIPVRFRNGLEFPKGMELLQKLVITRAFPGVSWEQNRNLITHVFDSVDTLNRLCMISGGHVRNLLMLLRSCLEIEDPPISRQCLDKVIRRYRNEFRLTIDAQQWELLRYVAHEKTVPKRREEQEEFQRLIRNLFIFEYHEEDASWFDINPVLGEAPELLNNLI